MEPLMSPTNGPRSFPAKPVDPPVGQTVVPAGSQQGSLSKAQARSLSKALAAYLAGPPRRSQRELARRLGVNQSFISKILRGVRSISLKLAIELHAKTGISLDHLQLPRKRHKQPRPPSTT